MNLFIKMTKIDSKIPEGPVAEKWTNYKAHQKLVNPANKRRLDIIVACTLTRSKQSTSTANSIKALKSKNHNSIPPTSNWHVASNIRPLLSGGSGIMTFEKQHPSQMPTALEAGTLNGHGIAGLRAALLYIKEQGMEHLRKREQQLMRRF